MIIETIISTINLNGLTNFAPCGVIVPETGARLAKEMEIGLRLYQGSQTRKNLEERPEGVINISQDILAFVDTALFSKQLPASESRKVQPLRMSEAQAVGEFELVSIDDKLEPTYVRAKIVHYEEFKGYSGFCRAQAVIIEALIQATRIAYLKPESIINNWVFWEEVVQKTGGNKELEALTKIKEYLILNGVRL